MEIRLLTKDEIECRIAQINENGCYTKTPAVI